MRIAKIDRSELPAMHAALEAWLDGTSPQNAMPYYEGPQYTFLLLDLLKDAREAFLTLKDRVDAAGIP